MTSLNPRLMRLAGWLSLCLALSCTACSALPPVQAPPQLVRATEYRYVQIPAADTIPCPRPTTAPTTNGELLQHDQDTARAAKCDEDQLAKIASESGKVPGVATRAASIAADPPTSKP